MLRKESSQISRWIVMNDEWCIPADPNEISGKKNLQLKLVISGDDIDFLTEI